MLSAGRAVFRSKALRRFLLQVSVALVLDEDLVAPVAKADVAQSNQVTLRIPPHDRTVLHRLRRLAGWWRCGHGRAVLDLQGTPQLLPHGERLAALARRGEGGGRCLVAHAWRASS